MRVWIHSHYKNIPFEVELIAHDHKSLKHLKGIIRAIHKFIDEITKKEVSEG